MISLDLFHGTKGDNILSIQKEGLIRPANGEIYFGRRESQFHSLFQYGADTSRSAAFVIKARVQLPDLQTLKPLSRLGAPADAWVVNTTAPLRAEILQLFVRIRPGEPILAIAPAEIANYLRYDQFRVVIKRKQSFAESIIGELYVNDAFLCYTLELAWLWNEKNRSCVPPGEYRAHLRFDHKDKWRIELIGVPGNRQNVQIHIGNYPRDVLGCVLVGTQYKADMVLNSTQAYEKLKAAYRQHPGPVTVKFEGILATPWGDYPQSKNKLA
jgi:hypothetical protein